MKYGLFLVLLTFCACGNPNVPLDASERRRVDSLSAAGIGVARRELDSVCKIEKVSLMPALVDSIKKVRLKRIEEQLKQIPK